METFSTNSIGTLNILESIRDLKKKCNIIIITSDKCYENREVKKGIKKPTVLVVKILTVLQKLQLKLFYIHILTLL